MLTDPTRSAAFRGAPSWDGSRLLDFTLRVRQDDVPSAFTLDGGRGGGGAPAYRSNSLSGHERNRLLISTAGHFSDVSLLGGVDCREDARSFATLDFDGDGWLDIALASPQAPRLRLFRNRVGELTRGGRVLSIALAGANHTSGAAGPRSNRDAVGAVVTARTSSGSRVFRRSLGEGLAAQNSRLIRVALAPGEALHEIRVRWPSGAESVHQPAPSERTLTIDESDLP